MVFLTNTGRTSILLTLRVILYVIITTETANGLKHMEGMKKFCSKLSSRIHGKGNMAQEKDQYRHDFDKEEMAEEQFPETLKEFGYGFDEGVLKHLETKESYQFNAKHNDHRYNQMRYEALGEIVTDYIYELMEEETKLKKVYIPIDAPEEEPRSFIFLSENWKTADKLLILIHGSGAVRAGQWSRKLIINDCIDSGSQLPYIRRGLKEGYGIIVMNPNLNSVDVNGEKIYIRGNSSPEDHGEYVWKHFIKKCGSKNIAIVAHSFGGVVTLRLLKTFTLEFISRVFAIAFTDSVHSCVRRTASSNVIDVIKNRAINFASSYDPLNTPLSYGYQDDCLSVSAGTEQHERTSWSSFEIVFEFIETRLDDWLSVPGEHSSDKASGDQASLPEKLDKVVCLDKDKKMKGEQDGDKDKKDGCRDKKIEEDKDGNGENVAQTKDSRDVAECTVNESVDLKPGKTSQDGADHDKEDGSNTEDGTDLNKKTDECVKRQTENTADNAVACVVDTESRKNRDSKTGGKRNEDF